MIVDVAAATTLNRLTHAAVVIVFYHCVAASCVHLIQLLHYIQSIILKSLLFFFLDCSTEHKRHSVQATCSLSPLPISSSMRCASSCNHLNVNWYSNVRQWSTRVHPLSSLLSYSIRTWLFLFLYLKLANSAADVVPQINLLVY